MLQKNQRILWLLNHKTLMRYEIPMLQTLGFEVYVPKIIPDDATTFRSGAVDYSSDLQSSLPSEVLRKLNSFPFYQDEWSTDMVNIVNHYFGIVFTMPIKYPLNEVLNKFKGQIVLRAFGLDNELNYGFVMRYEYGPKFNQTLQAIKDRFWFGQGYEQLSEVEQDTLKERALYLPVGLEDCYWNYENTWKGGNKHILLVCPDINVNPYYTKVYQTFKKELGDLPYFVIGQQNASVDDPNVLGYIDDESLIKLYQSSAAFYYHSRELRHLHYSPIEASIIGTPVIFYKESLMGRLADPHCSGSVCHVEEARQYLEMLLEGGFYLVQDFKNRQRNLAYPFSRRYCEPIWRANLLKGPFAQCYMDNTVFHNTSETEWFDTISFPDGTTTPGLASFKSSKARADVIFTDLKPGETVLDYGDGEGFYAFEAESRGAGRILSIQSRDLRNFLLAKKKLSSKVDLGTPSDFQSPTCSNLFDWVILRGIVNTTSNPLQLLEQACKLAQKRVVIESIMIEPSKKDPLMQHFGRDSGPGYPKNGFGFNPKFLESFLSYYGFQHFNWEPTPDAPSHRFIFTATKHNF